MRIFEKNEFATGSVASKSSDDTTEGAVQSAIQQQLIDQYGRKEIDEVYLVYSAFKSAASQAPTAEKIMPLSGLKGEKKDD